MSFDRGQGKNVDDSGSSRRSKQKGRWIWKILALELEVRIEGVIIAESLDILSGTVKGRKGIRLSKMSKGHRCSKKLK